MLVREVRTLATAWVNSRSEAFPDFRGAHLGGGITSLPAEATFAPYRDVDVTVLIELAPEPNHDHLEVVYEGLSIECGLKGVERYATPELILADPYLACHLAADSILSDPSGLLRQLLEAVARRYGERRWVAVRCAAAHTGAGRLLAQARLPETAT